MLVKSVPKGSSAAPPIANSTVKTPAAAGTESAAPIAAAGTTDIGRRGSTTRTALVTSQPNPTATRPSSVRFVPSAVNPPSAKSSAWSRSTTDITSTAVHGPTSTAASAPPIRCPLVPAPTGKLTIWVAKMNVAVRPASGACFSSSSSRDFRSATATPAAAAAPVAIEVGASKNPSGTCIPLILIANYSQ